jgi:hypothetical protein
VSQGRFRCDRHDLCRIEEDGKEEPHGRARELCVVAVDAAVSAEDAPESELAPTVAEDVPSFADPVFALCNGRLGSTLLRFLLDAHTELACPPEMNLPGLCAQLLQRVYPEARFICVYRHPMDVIASAAEACPRGLNGCGFEPYSRRRRGTHLDVMDELAGLLGYLAIDGSWGTTEPPADLRFPITSPPAAVDGDSSGAHVDASETGVIPVAAADAADAGTRLGDQSAARQTAPGRSAVKRHAILAAVDGPLHSRRLGAALRAGLNARPWPGWCELATVPPSAAEPFLQVFSHTRFVCVHRRCLDVVRAGRTGKPVGAARPGRHALSPGLPGQLCRRPGRLLGEFRGAAACLRGSEPRDGPMRPL